MKFGMILCSGGLDSVATAFYVKRKLNYEKLIILFFNYGQKSVKQERKCAKKCAENLNAKFIELKLEELSKLSSSLINREGKVNRVRRKELKDTRKESGKWYVPFRNALFLCYALALAESVFIKSGKKFDIFVGFKHEGRGGFPDTSLEFVRTMERIGKFGRGKFRILAPLINKDKADLVNLGKKLGVNFADTFSCYIGKRKHCSYCLACRLRQEGFYWANVKDPTKYQIKMNDFRRVS